MKKHILVILIIILGLGLRLYKLDQYPIPSETSDEESYYWMGYTMVREGVPTAWSWQPPFDANYRSITYDVAQKNQLDVSLDNGIPIIWYNEEKYPLIKPWLYGPHLFPFLIGVYSLLLPFGMFTFSLFVLRLLPVVLSLISLYLVFILAKLVYSEKIALIAALIYAVEPMVVITNRLLVMEQLLNVLLLLLAIVLCNYQKKSDHKWVIMLGILAGLSMLTKFAGIAAVGLIFVYLRKNKHHLGLALVIAFGIFSIYPLYSIIVDASGFFTMVFAQGARYKFSIEHLLATLFFGRIVSKNFFSGFMILGLYAVIRRKPTIVHQSIIVYIFTIMIVIGTFLFSWYRFPLFGFLSILVADYFMKISSYLELALVHIVLIMPLLHWVFIQSNPWLFRGMLLLMLPFAFLPRKWINTIKKGYLVSYIVISIMMILLIDTIYPVMFI